MKVKLPINVTQRQRDNALQALNVMWPSIPARNVIRELASWRSEPSVKDPFTVDVSTIPTCNTIACFGGWCPWWEPFAAQGVIVDPDSGVPDLVQEVKDRIRAHYSPFRHGANALVALHLFGFPELFYAQGEFLDCSDIKGYNEKNCSAHAAVTRRLKWLIKNSQVINNGKEWA